MKEGCMGYEGKIGNAGAQIVEAPNKQGKQYTPKVHRGDDLRSTAGSKKKK